MGFVFYDLETTGISPAYDQPLQFAAIRTDDDFIEIERINLRCRIAPHIIPSPQALIVTGVTPAQLAIALLREVADLERDDDGDVILGADANGYNDLLSRIATFLATHDQ